MRLTYISWAPHCSRSDYTARELGGTSHMVYWGWLGSHPVTVWLKYAGQTLGSWRILLTERPDVVFVMSPPPFAALAVYPYCLLTRARLVVDAHSGVFLTRRWRLFQGLNAWLSRRALTTIVTNEHLAGRIRGWGGHASVVPDVPIEYPDGEKSPLDLAEFTVVCVTSFDRDEPIDAIVEAARRLPDVPFLMTGEKARGVRAVGAAQPPNLTLTGFLDPVTYGALLRRGDVVIALTTDDHTMQRGAYEAIYHGTPVIVSDTPLLRAAFAEGAVHVDNSPEAIVKAVLNVKARRVEFRDAARRLRNRKRAEWERAKRALLEALGTIESLPCL